MAKIDKTYQELLHKIYYRGFEYEDPNRKGVIRKQIPYYNLEHDFEDGFPIIGLKQTFPKMAFNEMKTFMTGKNNLKDLEDLGITFWRDDAYNYYRKSGGTLDFNYWLEQIMGTDKNGKNFGLSENLGSLGKIYPHQIRNWNGQIDQLKEVTERLKKEPNSTKNIITMWNPSDLNSCSLSPCHSRFSFVVEPLKESYGLRIQWNQDSVDTFLGLPMNIMYYSFVCYAFANYLGMKPLGVIGNLTNVHLYDNSFSAVEEILSYNPEDLEPVEIKTAFSKDWNDLDDYLNNLSYKNNIKIENYKFLKRFDVKMLAYNK